MNENEKIITLDGMEYSIKTQNGETLTPDIIQNTIKQLRIKMNINSNSKSNIMKLGTPTCPSNPIPLNTVGTLTASVIQGTAPYTYSWLITKPDFTTTTLPNSAGPHSYTFNQIGTYAINLTVVDSCPTGTLTDTASCNVSVTPNTGSIEFITSPNGADIYLNGTLQSSKTPTTITNLTPGTYSYSLSILGYDTVTGTVSVTANQKSTVFEQLNCSTTIQCTFTCSSSVNVGDRVDLTATVTGGVAPYRMVFMKDGGWIGEVSNIGITNNTVTQYNYPSSAGTYIYSVECTDNCYNEQSITKSCSVTVLPTTGSITFNSTPPNADIYLDGLLQPLRTNTTITNVSFNVAHNYILKLTNYNDYTGSVTLTATNPNQTVSATLIPTPSYANWVIIKGGATALKSNLSALGEIIDAYLGMVNLGFTVTLANVGQTINYYLGV